MDEKERIDITGQKFGKLTVEEMLYNYSRNRPYCKCRCDCGNDTIKDVYGVRRGNIQSCGCLEINSRFGRGHAKTEIIEQKFNKLTVIRDSGKRARNGGVMWECLCDCGNITYANTSNLKRNHTTSCGCAKKEFIENSKIDVIGKKFGYITVIAESDTLSKRRKVIGKCDCGTTKEFTLVDLTTGHTSSCGCVFESKGEKLIKDFLSDNNIAFVPQKRFKDCKNKKPLPFDFWLPDHNICIEYNGLQHYSPVEYWGVEKQLKLQKKLDSIKKEYCSKNNIILLSIPYTMSDNDIKQTILNYLESRNDHRELSN